jgi:hypothetical protein
LKSRTIFRLEETNWQVFLGAWEAKKKRIRIEIVWFIEHFLH